MNKKQLDEIRARAEAATGGTWYTEEDDDSWDLYTMLFEGFDYKLAKCPKGGTQFAEYWPKPEDSDFIVHARQDVPDLLDYVKELEEKVEGYEYVNLIHRED